MNYLILNYRKTIGRTKTRNPRPETTVRGNVILTVETDFIIRFNVQIFSEHATPVQKQSSFIYDRGKKRNIYSPEAYRKARFNRGAFLVEISKKTSSSTVLSPTFLPKKHYLRFPKFFNTWMIDNALFQILKDASDFEDLRFSVNSGRIREIFGEETNYGTVTLSRTFIEGKTPENRSWGENCFIAPF